MLDFPTPTFVGQVFQVPGGTVYTWDGKAWTINPWIMPSSVSISDTLPSGPRDGDLWFNSTNGRLHIFYTDANSSQWVAVSSIGVNGTAATGSVQFFAASTPPDGWIKCNGAAVSNTAYAALWGVIGSTYNTGGEAAGTFRVPDLRGEFARGWDDGRGLDAGRVFGSAQLDDFKSHNHSFGFANRGLGADSCGTGYSGTATYVTSTVGGTETRPKNVALLACIKY